MSETLTKTSGLKYVQLIEETDAYRAALATGHWIDLLNAILCIKIEKLERDIKALPNGDTRVGLLIERFKLMDADQKEIERLGDYHCTEILGKVETFAGSSYYKVTHQELQKLERKLMIIAVRWDLIEIPDGNKNTDYRPREG